MAQNSQNCYNSFEAAEKAATERTARDGIPRGVWANRMGYWEPLTEAQIERRERREDTQRKHGT